MFTSVFLANFWSTTSSIRKGGRLIVPVVAGPLSVGLADIRIQCTTGKERRIRRWERMRTTMAGDYAVGDLTGRDQFVYMVAYGAKVAAHNVMNGDSQHYDNPAMPAVVFTDPQMASVSLTEARARERGIDVRTSVLTLDNVPRALVARDTRGLIKLVADGKTKKLIGVHILAPERLDSIQTPVLAIKTGMT